MRFASALLVVLWVGVAAAQPPSAAPSEASQDEEARALFQAGRLAFQGGRFEDALRHFQRAYELSERAPLLFNIGSAADRLRRNELALDAFRRYVEALPDAPNRSQVLARIEVLEREVEREQRLSLLEAERAAAPTASGAEHASAPAGPEASQSALRVAPLGGAPAEDRGGSVLETWWFWTLIGVAAVGAGVAVTAVLLSDGGEPAPLTGDNGALLFTLAELP